MKNASVAEPPLLLAFDPSLTCTGFAVLALDGSPNGKLMACGKCWPPKDGTQWERIRELLTDCSEVVAEHVAGLRYIVVETPQTFAKGLKGKRSAASLPGYGMCVGAVLSEMAHVVADSGGLIELSEVSATEWTRDAPGTKGDEHKTRRVEYVRHVYPDAPDLGPMSDAGNVADAILIGRYWIKHKVGPSRARKAS